MSDRSTLSDIGFHCGGFPFIPLLHRAKDGFPRTRRTCLTSRRKCNGTGCKFSVQHLSCCLHGRARLWEPVIGGRCPPSLSWREPEKGSPRILTPPACQRAEVKPSVLPEPLCWDQSSGRALLKRESPFISLCQVRFLWSYFDGFAFLFLSFNKLHISLFSTFFFSSKCQQQLKHSKLEVKDHRLEEGFYSKLHVPACRELLSASCRLSAG